MFPATAVAGRYSVGPVIGRGGMAEVHSGIDKRLERPVAIKMMLPAMAAEPNVRRRFEAEARLVARLSHPHVVNVYDSGEDDGLPWIVMELLPGYTLRDRLARGPMSIEETRRLADHVLSALDAAHMAGIVHRDIKPGNILGTPDGGWKVGDFGIAKALEAYPADQTVTGMLMGTPAYLAPERFGGAAATAAGDIFAVGVVLYEALAGRRPYSGTRPETWAVAAAGQLVPLSSLRTDVPPALAAAVERCMAPDPADRWPGAAAARTAILGAAPAGASPYGAPLVPAPAQPTEVMADAPPGPALAPLIGRARSLPPRTLAAVGAAAVVALVVILSLGAGHHHASPVRAQTTVPATTVAPTTPAPTTVAPTTVAPTTVAPTTVAPTTVAPTTAPRAPAGPPAHPGHGHGGGRGGGG